MGGRLNQQAVIIRADDRAGVSIACIQTDTKAGAGTVIIDSTCVRCELICRIFSGNSALDRKTSRLNGFLRSDSDFLGIQCETFCNEDLAFHDVISGGHFRNGMLDLNARIHFDKIMVAVLVYEKLNGTGTSIIHGFRYLDRIGADRSSHFFCQGKCRSEFHDFLMTSLNGAVSLEKVDQISVLVA